MSNHNTLQNLIGIPFSPNLIIHPGHWLKITRPDGSAIRVRIVDNNVNSTTTGYSNTFTIGMVDAHGLSKQILNWHNCYSFGNGVESNRITDNFNTQHLTPGVRVSAAFEDYKEEHRKYGLIYSGLYNSIGSINNLNQFIQAERITKDINPTYGSIQKLHARDTDLIALCEDKVLRILASKDAVYNADGNSQLTATNRVLGQTVPFVGEYGISKNPESFVSEAYRSYFTDKQRGAVMRLSRDGLTPISAHGMKDWFRDNLKEGDKLIGSYDDRNDEYNLTLDATVDEPVLGQTVSFREDVIGWVSFKSFVPENAISCANDYFTISDGKLYKHYVEVLDAANEDINRNTFYGEQVNSSVNVILNDFPGSIKSFHTLDYEGSQSRIEGIRTVKVTGIEHVDTTVDGKYFFFDKEDMGDVINEDDLTQWDGEKFDMKQYRNNILVFDGSVKLMNTGNSSNVSSSGGLTKGHGRRDPYDTANPGDFQVGDIITTRLQEKSVSHFNSAAKDGWHVSDITTDKQKGSLNEFIEKEGKWFNYIKGIDSDVTPTTDFGSFDIQGLGIVERVKPKNIVDMHRVTSTASGFTVMFKDIASWDGTLSSSVVPNDPQYLENIMRNQDMKVGTVPNYRLTLTISNYSGAGSVGVSNNAGVSGGARRTSNGVYTEDFISDGNPITIFGRGSNIADIEVSVANLPTLDGELVFVNDINSSLQIGDTLYFESSSEILGENLLPELIAENWYYSDELTVTFDEDGVLVAADSAVITTQYPSIWSNAINLVDGKEYQLDITISDYDNGSDTSFVIKNYIRGMEQATWQVPNPPNASSPEYRPITNSSPEVIVGQATYSFVFDRHDVSVGNSGSRTVRFQLELRGGNTDSKSVRLKNVSLREFSPGNIFGFTKLESENIQKCGVVTELIKDANILENQRRVFNTVTFDGRGGTLPSVNDYIFFVKNQTINTSSLLGYYADVKLENNSKSKVEIFSVNSEITESSK